ncbi:probable chitinase 10 [Pecten maximus]|uniref:probable chitinase 10 n=1 Tax=Pecten maximus TaxID=6579 RepID=UPI001458A918|nr:probable chitinase 10 [Pecten maximus]
MEMKIYILIAAIVLCSACYTFAEYRRVCYYTNWSRYRRGLGQYFPNHTDPHLCTHLIFSFAKLEKSELAFYDGDENLYKEINDLKKVNPKLKTMLAVGGWTQESIEWSATVSKTNKMNKFIVKSIPFLRKYRFDGLDLDWEYPALRAGANATTDKHNFGILCKKLRLAYDREARLTRKPRLLLSVAVGAAKKIIDVSYEVPTISKYVDFINLMSYDLHGSWLMYTGHHSLLFDRGYNSENAEDVYLDIDWAARYWVLLGAPKEQINIGLSFYGRGFTLKDPKDNGFGAKTKGPNRPGPFTRESGYVAYYEVCMLLSRGGQAYREAGEPYYVNGNQWIGYDDEESIANKVAWLISEGFGGAMMWALPLDDFNMECPRSNRKFPLANRVKDDLLAAESVVTATTVAAAVSSTSTEDQWSILKDIVSVTGHRLVCIYDVWSSNRPGIGRVVPDDIDPHLCTHLIFANAMIKKNGAVLYRRRNADTVHYEPFTNLTLKNPSLKALIMITEDVSKGMAMSVMAEDPTTRAAFVASVITFCRKRSFDGVALQWTVRNSTHFKALSEELRAAFDAENTTEKLILAAQLAGHSIDDIDAYYDKYTIKTTIIDNYDFVNLDTYSLYDTPVVTAHHSRITARDDSTGEDKFLNIKSIAAYFTYLGVPKSMINVGIATYGSGYTLTNTSDYGIGAPVSGGSISGNFSNTPSFLAYYEICSLLNNNDGTMYSDFGVPYYVRGDQWIGYDDITSLTEKAEWIVNEGYGGTSIWSLTFDDYNQNCPTSDRDFPLINTIKDVFDDAAKPKLYRRVCYFSTWSEDRPGKGAFMADDIDPDLCTHLVVAFAEVSENSTLEAYDAGDISIYQRAIALKGANPDLKVLLSVGGWAQGSERFSFMVSGPKRRRNFTSSAMLFLRMYGFDGLDLAWLYPTQRDGGEDTDRKNFGILVKLMRREFDGETLTGNMTKLMLTASVAAEQEHIDYAYDVKALSENLDYISIQTFDMHGHWDMETGHQSQLRPFPYQTGTEANLNMDFAGKYWQMLGVDKDKINIGIPTFGRGFNVSDANMDWRVGLPIDGPSKEGPYTDEEGFLAYYELCDLPGTEKNLGDAIIKYGDDNLWIGFENADTLQRKMLWLMSEGYGGVMIWSLDLDDFKGNCSDSTSNFHLINQIKDTLLSDPNGLVSTVPPPSTTTFETTTMEETTTPIPSTTQEAFVNCTAPPTGGPYPNNNDCRTFYKCSHGVAHLYNCPGPLSYDRAHRVCNWDRHTNC